MLGGIRALRGNSGDVCSFLIRNHLSPQARRRGSTLTKSDDFERAFLSCLPGLEPILSDELKQLGIQNTQTRGGAVVRNLSKSQALRCHLHLGSASHLYIRCTKKPFRCWNFNTLSSRVKSIPWEDILDKDADFTVKAICTKSKLIHRSAVQGRVRWAIEKRMGRRANQDMSRSIEPDTSPGRKVVPIMVTINRDLCMVNIDTSITPIHRRGYRVATTEAPLREDIAYAMLYGVGLGYHPDSPFQSVLDPMCGTGTIAIEAAGMLAGLPPGRLREAPFRGTRWYDPRAWEAAQDEILNFVKNDAPKLGRVVCGSDREELAVEASIQNAEAAGVSEWCDFRKCRMSKNEWLLNSKHVPTRPLLVATNPPFGKRLSETGGAEFGSPKELLHLYQSLGHRIKKAHAESVILTAGRRIKLARRTGLKQLKAMLSTNHGGVPIAMMSPLKTLRLGRGDTEEANHANEEDEGATDIDMNEEEPLDAEEDDRHEDSLKSPEAGNNVIGMDEMDDDSSSSPEKRVIIESS